MQRTLAKIDVGAIAHNAALLRARSGGRPLFAVVKADAYGHGAIPVARRLSGVADMFCVAIADEGVELRAAGISLPILVFTPPQDREDALRMSAYDLTATVADVRSARLARGLSVHIKINTGMNRLGCPPNGLDGLLGELEGCAVTGVYSHMYAPLSDADTAFQLEAFKAAAGKVKAKFSGAVAHFAATAGILCRPDCLFDAVRPGLGLYGYAPEGLSCDGLRPALRVYARRLQTFEPPFGGGAGYARAQRQYARLSSYRAGYAEGFARGCPLGTGCLCMDSFISESAEDELCIFDNAAEYAARAGTVCYEVLCAVTRRSERVYYEG